MWKRFDGDREPSVFFFFVFSDGRSGRPSTVVFATEMLRRLRCWSISPCGPCSGRTKRRCAPKYAYNSISEKMDGRKVFFLFFFSFRALVVRLRRTFVFHTPYISCWKFRFRFLIRIFQQQYYCSAGDENIAVWSSIFLQKILNTHRFIALTCVIYMLARTTAVVKTPPSYATECNSRLNSDQTCWYFVHIVVRLGMVLSLYELQRYLYIDYRKKLVRELLNRTVCSTVAYDYVFM